MFWWTCVAEDVLGELFEGSKIFLQHMFVAKYISCIIKSSAMPVEQRKQFNPRDTFNFNLILFVVAGLPL